MNRNKRFIIKIILFVTGIILSVVLTSIVNNLIPSNPVIIKQESDTVRVIHEFPDGRARHSKSKTYNKSKNYEKDTLRRSKQ